VSQEDVCKLWVVLCPAFTDAYNKIRIPEESFNTAREKIPSNARRVTVIREGAATSPKKTLMKI